MMTSGFSRVDFRSSLIMRTPNWTCSGASACPVMIVCVFDLAGIFFHKKFLSISVNCCLVSITLSLLLKVDLTNLDCVIVRIEIIFPALTGTKFNI